MRWIPTLATLAATAALWWVAVWAYPRLPPKLPVHFDLAGNPDRWVDRGPGEWFMLPVIGTFVALLCIVLARGLPWLAVRYPGIINVPQAHRFRGLDPDARVRALAPMGFLMEWTAALVIVLFATISWGSFEVATGVTERLSPVPLFVGLPGYLIGVAILSWMTRAAILREWAIQQAAQQQAS